MQAHVRERKIEDFRRVIQTQPSRLMRDGLIRVLQEAPETVRPPRLHRLRRADLLASVERLLRSPGTAVIVASLVRKHVAAQAQPKKRVRACTTSPKSEPTR